MQTLSPSCQSLLQSYTAHFTKKKAVKPQAAIHVDEVALEIAKFYEMIRNIVDYREMHLLRKNAILRALGRGLLLYGRDSKIAELLIREIIRSGHLPNDTISEEKVVEVERILSNLIFFLESLKKEGNANERRISKWLIRITAPAIEESLDLPIKDRLMSDTMLLALKDRLIIKGAEINERDKAIQLFISIQRALLRVDDDQLEYRLVKLLYPYWDTPSPEEREMIATKLPLIKKTLAFYISHPIQNSFFKLGNRYNTPFLLLKDAIFNQQSFSRDPEELFRNKETLDRAIESVYLKRYAQQRKHLRRLAFFTVLSLFITKVLIALAVEVPIEAYLTHDYSLINTSINIVFPPALMGLIILFIRPPSKENINFVKKELYAVVFEKYRKEYLLVVPKEKDPIIQKLVWAFYSIVSLAVFSSLVAILSLADFSIASIAVFIIFTSVVAATGMRVRNRSKELSMEEEKTSLVSFFTQAIVMPFVTLGQLIIEGLSKFPLLVMLINLIDVPFQMFLVFIENFSEFIRRKKEELY